MDIAIVGPGIMPIPPTGWGAVEILIWDYKCQLKKLGHKVDIINTPNRNEIINLCNSKPYDFVHIQYDDFWSVVPSLNCSKIGITSHFGYLEQVFEHPCGRGYTHIFEGFRQIVNKCYIFCLSDGIKNYYSKHSFPEKRLKVAPNGARDDLFAFSETCKYPDRSLYLAKIDYRKRQTKFQGYNAGIYFAGKNDDHTFNVNDHYLGEWNKDYLYKNLTDYANLILLSDGEADPLVTKEALMAGLGVVVSSVAAANLDPSLPFIDIITENRINDVNYVKEVIANNRIKSIANRKQIRAYGETFSWGSLVKNYVNTIEGL